MIPFILSYIEGEWQFRHYGANMGRRVLTPYLAGRPDLVVLAMLGWFYWGLLSLGYKYLNFSMYVRLK
jgi:hypothetical protein